ncbi:nicotinate-nucleotide adenylyltransferase [Pseudanabaena sp. FACHB-2040]|uniref:nicotinate-nucleotide adenylyltransferase n=1 Tax=Pseudanabaena sp. FACHB-2040 TaxID=2692859 RepID=UPI001685F4E5|nr:nicotinate-nucleotide adenylyltransferase [Pseudanabaena sp. FACHB-2040]MBD0267954.1 nicotinate-nucleotide adenylyltransferase [Cyanobacteria bacterium Co-bin8]MBD2258650.1 nicotinate-nucleotide adenylyltransferase [Pseudanabaena sp. FACHB-2040]
MQIALFGTSADPPHQGHCAILCWLATRFDHVAVWTANNPFKAHQTDLADRFRMLELLIADLNVPPGTVQLHPELSHMRSIISIERARQKWPEAELTLVIGADLVHQLPHWYQAQEIFEAVKILVVPRPGYSLADSDFKELQRQGAVVEVAATPKQYDVSSSQYRDAEAAELPPAVRAYIEQNHLYSCPEDSREKLSVRKP